VRGGGRWIAAVGSIATVAAIGLTSSARASGNTFAVCLSGCTFTSRFPTSPLHLSRLPLVGGVYGRGVFIPNGRTGFTVTNNNIHDLRNGILIDGRNAGAVTDNVIEDTKGAISVQYTDGSGLARAECCGRHAAPRPS